MSDPTDETPAGPEQAIEQAVEQDLRAAQARIRDAGSVLRDALAEDDRLPGATNGTTGEGQR